MLELMADSESGVFNFDGEVTLLSPQIGLSVIKMLYTLQNLTINM